MNKHTQYITHSAMIATLYVIFTLLSSLLGLSSGVIQVRISEALCILAIFTPAAIPGLTIGCFIANMLSGNMIIDVFVGTLATFIGALIGWYLRKYPYIVPFPTILANAIIIPVLLQYVYTVNLPYYVLFATVGAGELISAYIGGILLYHVLRRVPSFQQLYHDNLKKS